MDVATDIGSSLYPVACGAATAVAAGTGDLTAVTGATIDRLGFQSCIVTFAYLTTLTAAKTLSIASEYQESADGSSWDTAVALQASTAVKTGAVTAFVGTTSHKLNLAGKKRYIRFNFTPDLSHTSADTVVIAATAVLGGASVKPTTATYA
jgi:hypothetical protein